MSLPDLKRVTVQSRAEWRAWLSEHHASSGSIWLVRYKKASGKPHVGYDEVVEEALCFGWIDSRPAKLDEERSMLLLSPRKPGSAWSLLNKQRVARLDALVYPDDLTAALQADEQASRNFESFNRSSRRGILEWIQTAKRSETRAARIAATVRLAREGIRASHPEARGR